MHLLQGQVQAELPCPLSCGNPDTSKAKNKRIVRKVYWGDSQGVAMAAHAAGHEMVGEEARDVQCRLFRNSLLEL
jgi:hypothetical protein